MATNGILSVQTVDADGDIASIVFPFTNSDNLLATILAWAAALLTALDPVLDVKMNKVQLCISVPIPSGAKGSPVAGAESQRTGLFTNATSGLGNVAYGLDLAGFAYSKFVDDTINQADTDVAAFITAAGLNAIGGVTHVTDRNFNDLQEIKSAKKTFRKRRRT